jgi:hypothetical protein
MLIGSIPVSQRGDLQWVYQRTTVLHETVGVRKLENGQAEMFWSPASSSAVLQSSESLTTPSWSNVAAAAVSELGLTRVTTSIEESERYYRVK